MGEPKPEGTVSFWWERRRLYIDDRLTVKQAKRLLEGGAPHLVYPLKGQQSCPVKVGERFTIVPHQFWIEVTKITAKAGEWRVTYRIIDFRPNLLGNKAGTTSDQRRAIRTVEETEDGQRVREPEYVEDGWHDQGKAKREAMRLEAVKEANAEAVAMETIQRLKARLNQVGVAVVRDGIDIQPYADRIFAVLKEMETESRSLERAA